jgi:hypothetical protein
LICGDNRLVNEFSDLLFLEFRGVNGQSASRATGFKEGKEDEALKILKEAKKFLLD